MQGPLAVSCRLVVSFSPSSTQRSTEHKRSILDLFLGLHDQRYFGGVVDVFEEKSLWTAVRRVDVYRAIPTNPHLRRWVLIFTKLAVLFCYVLYHHLLVLLLFCAARSKASVCGRWLAGIELCKPVGDIVSIVCCRVEVFATGRSFIQRSPTDCRLSECDRDTSTRRRTGPIKGCRATGEKNLIRVL